MTKKENMTRKNLKKIIFSKKNTHAHTTPYLLENRNKAEKAVG